MTGSSSHSRDQNTQNQSMGTLSLAPILAAQAFGFQTGGTPGGGLSIYGGPAAGDQPAVPQVFTPQMFSQLSQLANPYESFLGGQGTFNQLGQQSQQLLTNVLPGINEMATTGFGDEINRLSSFLFENELAPQLEEQFGAQLGLDVGDADMRSALIREGKRTSLEAANQAIQNRMMGLQLGMTAPGQVAQTAGMVESGLQQASRQASPEGQLLDLLMTFGGVESQAGGIGQSYAKGSSNQSSGGIK